MSLRTISLALVLSALLPALHARAQAPSWVNAWSISMAGTEAPIGGGVDIAGNIYLAGFARNMDATDPRNAITQFLYSATPVGEVRWNRAFLAGVESASGAMTVDAAGNSYVAASFSGSGARIDRGTGTDTLSLSSGSHFLASKYDAAGMLLWHLVVSGGDSLTVTGIAAVPGGVWICGMFTGTVDIGGTQLTSAGGSDLFLAMIDSAGTVRRAIREGGTSTDQCYGIATGPGGDLAIVGLFSGTAGFGDQTLTASGGTNLFLVRLHADGSVVWARADGGSAFTPVVGFGPMLVRFDGEGNVYLGIAYFGRASIAGTVYVASAEDEADALVVKFRPDGAPAWAVPFNGEILRIASQIM